MKRILEFCIVIFMLLSTTSCAVSQIVRGFEEAANMPNESDVDLSQIDYNSPVYKYGDLGKQLLKNQLAFKDEWDNKYVRLKLTLQSIDEDGDSIVVKYSGYGAVDDFWHEQISSHERRVYIVGDLNDKLTQLSCGGVYVFDCLIKGVEEQEFNIYIVDIEL